jgi:outer membrane protein TolC
MRQHVAATLTGIALTILTGTPAWAFDVDRFLAAAASQPQADIAASEAAVETAGAAQTALLPPWQMELRQEGLGPTDPGNQVTYLSLQTALDPFGQRASQSRSQTLHAESLQFQSRQVRLDQQLQDLSQAWRILSLRDQLTAIDAAVAGLPTWQTRIRLRVEAGKLPAMMLARILGVESEWRSRRLTLQRELAAAEAQLAARGLLPLVDGPLPALINLPKPAEPTAWPEALALQTEERSLQAADEAVRKQAIPQTNLTVEGQRYETFSAGQHTLGVALGWTLPNGRHLDLERERLGHQRQQLAARQLALAQRQRALTGRYQAMQRTGIAEWTELQQRLLPNLDRQTQQTQSLIERGLSDVWPWVDLRRTHLDAQLRAIEAHAAALEGGYGLWLLAAGSSPH